MNGIVAVANISTRELGCKKNNNIFINFFVANILQVYMHSLDVIMYTTVTSSAVMISTGVHTIA